MPKLTKLEFASLVRSMPNANHEEILNAATQAENATPAEEPSTLKKVWDFANTPLTDAPSRLAKKSADQIDAPSLTSERDTIDIPGFGKFNSRGFVAGITQGAGDVASSLTSPLNLALTALGMGGEAAGARGALGISKAARLGEKALLAPIAGEGAYNTYEGVKEGDYAKAGQGAMQVAGAAAGMKNAGEHAFPPAKVRDAYMKSKGRELTPTPRVEKLDTDFAKRTADAYEAMPHAPQHPAVAAAYKAMADETSDQFKFLRDQAGVKMEPWTKEGQPYANSKEMMTDVLKNNRLFYFPSEAGFGEAAAEGGNPLLQPGKSGAPVNDEFRASHDYFGHAVEGNQFGPLGEERAYQAHRQMFPEEAVPALTTETRGQNSWVNFGRHLRREDGAMPKAGEPGFVKPQDRPFAEQKTGLLPEEFQRANAGQSAPTVPAALGRDSSLASSPKPASLSTGNATASPSAPAYGLDDAAVKVSELTRQKDGASFNLHHGDLINTDNYAVSVYPDRGVVIDGQASPEDISSFVHKNQDLLQDPKNSIGTWFNKDDGKTYLDISVTVPSLDEALKLGQDKGQLAIFDLKNMEEIKVPKSGTSMAAPGVTPLAGNVPPEFHAVEARTGEPTKGLPAPAQVTDQPLVQYGSGQKVAEQKQKLDAFRAQAAEARGEVAEPRGATEVPPASEPGKVTPFSLPDYKQTGAALVKQLKKEGKSVEEINALRKKALNGSGNGLATASAIAAPAVSQAIPDDPDSKWDDYGRLGLNLLGVAGIGAAGAAALREPRTGQKLHSSRAAGMMLAGVPKKEIALRLVKGGAPQQDVAIALKGAEKLLDQQVEKIGTKLTSTKKLLNMFHEGSGEMKWYDDTFKELQGMFGKDAEMMAGFLSATSINSTVKSNASLALKAFKQWKAGDEFSGYLPSVIQELNRVKNGEPLGGRKLDNFRKAIIGDPNAVVVDRWMLRAFGDQKSLGATPRQYDMIEHAITELAKQQGVTPRQMQAAIWFGVKNAAEKGKARPESPSFGTAINERIGKDHVEAIKEDKKITKSRQNPDLF